MTGQKRLSTYWPNRFIFFSQFLLLPFAIILLIFPIANAESRCNYVTLVKCFIEILDEWTWRLYELKDNVATINNDQCQHLRELDKCIQVLNNTNVVIQRSCLSRERIGEMTISAGTYLSEKFLDHPDEEVCTAVNNKVQEYMEAMTGLCREEASLIMCRSLTGMFKGLHSDILADCEFSCLRKQESSQRDSQQEQPQQDQQYDENSTTEEGDEGKKIVYSVMMALKLNKSSRLPLGMILILMRWKYARLQMMNFHDDITKWFGGDSSHSVLIHKTGVCSFNVRYSQFRKQMDRLKSTQTKDLVFSQVPREKYVLLQQTFRQLNHHYVRWLSGLVHFFIVIFMLLLQRP
uniref:Uncharacterized protein n=1 Tax=Meloidogyne enterolobii TaxID=390850 RepID=A0A6V7UB99_MELEN|nr:unnamed protein product [Meloidogyne enterolobii]